MKLTIDYEFYLSDLNYQDFKMQGKAKKFKMILPIQITGMVFWGLLLVCSLLAVIILQKLETDFVSNNQDETLILSYEIEEIVEQYSMPPALIMQKIK